MKEASNGMIRRVILDLDYTLLNTATFKNAMGQSVADLGISDALFWKTYEETVRAIPGQYDYDVDRHVALLKSYVNRPLDEAVDRIIAVMNDMRAHLYPDALPFLTFLQEHGVAVALVTLGNKRWQEEKIRQLDIAGFFDNIISTEQPKENLKLAFLESEESWLFIDDSPKELHSWKALYPRATFAHIRRAEGKAAHAAAIPNIPAAHSLKDIQERFF